ncbi:type II toxin-antitoxin system RelE/ParE family toxin [Sulfitobacter mediterraneus]|uniref:type II toxin-antitoxin system RelE/ParE family toxin n=1 Tax=Sulfitobacter mediterraneus TaxID=83219 RepID=UPI0021A6EF47|nr:type II toxin-antitoxin system RelE/ParE family toxin [Sulfitobacter mediterraneus]UWR13407.1 type II toxin-antitoxin system RelE/ParE family toxin [Sulfitobacter mediterraneus]
MKPVHLSPAAQADVEDIWDYTETTWGSAQAEKYIGDIQQTCHGVATGRAIVRSAESIRAGYQRSNVGSHVLYFKELEDRFVIVRILHQKMDVGRYIAERS